MSYDRLREQITGPMTTTQAHKLRKLAMKAYQEKLFEPQLSSTEASRRIHALRREIALANSF